MDGLALADALEKAIADPEITADEFGEYVRMRLPTILAALRSPILAALSPATGRAEGEAPQVVVRSLSPEEAQARYQALLDARWRERLAESRALPTGGAGHD